MITLDPPRSWPGAAQPFAPATEAEAWRVLGLSRAGLTRFLRAAQAAVALAGEVDVLLADDRTLRRLNREWRRKNKPTDVLSFPASAELAAVHAGDLAVSLETAARQAAEHGHTLNDELRVLLLHGLLHLDGMDHEVDHGEMAAREDQLRAKLRLKRGLIARVEAPAVRSGRTKRPAKKAVTKRAAKKVVRR
jgi:probable rRNA maturation factor